jgi:hypothetical protein
MRRLLWVAALTVSAVLISGGAALACENHYPPALMYVAGNPAFLAGVLGASVIAGLVRLVRR